MVCVSATAYADEVVEITEEPQTLEVYCPGANEDPEFPFSFDIDVDPSTISYIDLDEPPYGFEQLLDEEALDFDVRFALKDEYKNFDSFEFQVLDADYTEEIAAGTFQNDEVFTIPGLSIGTTYKLSMVLNSETLTAYYGGQFTIQAELDSTLAVDLFYQLANIDGDSSLYVSIYSETESNNSESVADEARNGAMIEGHLYDYSDVDYFYFYTPSSNSGNVATVDISLSVPKGLMIDMEVYSLDRTYTKSTVNSLNSSLYVRITNAAPNTKFYIKLKRSVGSSNDKYCLMVQKRMGYAWFGQYSSYEYPTSYWNDNKLSSLNITAYSETNPFFINNGNGSTYHWMMKGCGIAASATILRNMGATLKGYDFRTDYYGNMPADPFTVMLANCELDGTSMNVNTTSLNTGFQYPNSLTIANVCEGFKVSQNSITFEEVDKDESSLKEAAKIGPILIRFGKGEYRHFMVITGFTEGNNFADRVLVCDPAGNTYATGVGTDGRGIPLSKTTSGYADFENCTIIGAKRYKIAQ